MSEFNELFKAIVKINTSKGSGTGFYLSNDDVILTNHHVVAGQRSVSIETQDKEKQKAQVVQVNPLLDLAILKLAKPLQAPQLILRKNDSVANMDKVLVCGYPYGMPFTVTEGIVSSSRQLLSGQYYIQTDAAVNPGNSGGPMMNQHGEVVGITTSKFTEADNMGFALPASKIFEELDLFRENPVAEYTVKCPSCNAVLFEKSEYCDNCGVKLEVENLFSVEQLGPLALFIEGVIAELGIDPVIARCGNEFWEFYKGSALLRYFVYKQNYFIATCPLAKLPKTDIEEILRYTLSNPVPPYSLGIDQGIVYVSYRFHLSDIDTQYRDSIRTNLMKLAEKADELDNYLVETYGAEWPEESKHE